MGIRLLSYGMAKANNAVKNSDFEKILDTSDEWIFTRTGIKQRRFVSDGQSNESMAIQSAKQAVEKSGVNISNIEVCIVATMTPDKSAPCVACEVAKNLGLGQQTICFDLNAACSGFVTALNAAHGLLENKNKYALIVGSEVLSGVLDMKDRTTAVLFGDGAGAVLIKRDDNLKHAFLGGYVPDDNNVLYEDKATKRLNMDGKAVFRFATEKMSFALNSILTENNLHIDDIDLIVPHQANKRIIDYVQKKMNISADKFFMNLQDYGNTSAASIPIALYEANLKQNKKVICVGFGAGLTYGAILLNT